MSGQEELRRQGPGAEGNVYIGNRKFAKCEETIKEKLEVIVNLFQDNTSS